MLNKCLYLLFRKKPFHPFSLFSDMPIHLTFSNTSILLSYISLFSYLHHPNTSYPHNKHNTHIPRTNIKNQNHTHKTIKPEKRLPFCSNPQKNNLYFTLLNTYKLYLYLSNDLYSLSTIPIYILPISVTQVSSHTANLLLPHQI